MSKNLEKEIEKSERKIEKEKNRINRKIVEFKDNNIKSYIESLQSFHIPRWEELPSIDLYLDQLVTLLDNCLSPYIATSDDPLITKTMINNYVKQGIIVAPEKKKYGKKQIASLFVICTFKPMYSISNIHSLIKLATTDFRIETSYNRFCELFENSLKSIFAHNGIDYSEKTSLDDILLQNAVKSVAYKIYVEKTFLNK